MNPTHVVNSRTLFIALLLAFLAVDVPAREPAAQTATLESLQQRLASHVTDPRFDAAEWGVKVVSLETGRTLFEHNAGKLFSPASNSKLYTCALALDRLGADHRIKTSLYAAAPPDKRGTLKGDLIIYGRGDPTFNTRLNNGDIYKALDPLVDALVRAGVKRIQGDLVGDDSYLPGPPYGSGWSCDDMQYYYGAEISALTINDNILALSVKPGEAVGSPCRLELTPATSYVQLVNLTRTVPPGEPRRISLYRPLGRNVTYVSGQLPVDDAGANEDVTVHNPAGLFAACFKEALARRGITVSGGLRTAGWMDRKVAPLNLDSLVELGSVESLPMRDLVREVQKPSQNLYTDLLLAHVAMQTNPPRGSETAEDAGIRELTAFLSSIGINPGEVRFEEGSGLSRNNMTTPNATIKLLQHMHQHRWAGDYIKALPVGGVDGTLRRRMKETPAEGNVRAKTGTLRWAHALSGHVTTAAGETLVFSIMLNRYYNPDPNRSARADVDGIAVMLAEFTGHSAR